MYFMATAPRVRGRDEVPAHPVAFASAVPTQECGFLDAPWTERRGPWQMRRVVKIATWNVNSVRARLERLLGYLAAAKPDVLCLQELKCTDEAFPKAEIEKA